MSIGHRSGKFGVIHYTVPYAHKIAQRQDNLISTLLFIIEINRLDWMSGLFTVVIGVEVSIYPEVPDYLVFLLLSNACK